jgi:uncharacterized protein YjlB
MMKTPRQLYFEKGPDVPNSTLPALLFRGVLPRNSAGKVRRFRAIFKRNGWIGEWTDTIYDYTHFHSNAHEVLGIAKGVVTLQLGGETGRRFRLKAGDMLILPAGIGHRRVGDDEGLKVVGAYPRGQAQFNIKRSGRALPKVVLPATDPFYGEDGPLVHFWSN